MKKKICPICDTELKNGTYCRVCRKRVLHPKVEERNYYLNERHSGSGVPVNGSFDREFRGSDSSPDRISPASAGGGARTNPQKRQDTPYYEKKEKIQPIYRSSSERSAGTAGRINTPSAAKVVIAVFLVIIAVNFMTVFMTVVKREMMTEKVELEYGADDFIWEETEEEENPGFEVVDLEPSMLKAAGESCSFYSHADMDGETAKALVESFLTGRGIGEFRIEEEAFNKKYVYEEEDDRTIFDTCVTYFPGGETGGGSGMGAPIYFSVGYDTGSGQLHYFQFETADIDFASEAAAVFSTILDQLDESQSIEPEAIRTGVFELQYADPEDYETDLWLQGDDWLLYGYKESDDSYYISVESSETGDDYDDFALEIPEENLNFY